ncbi:oxygen-independent coproporphyrinogen-3 oxidase [Pedobacter sp. UYP30]|uniref:radical SAM family heme chaperone HemW n=1 Tax=Pedobacter sp. UYP30 TaxID=1756400 RepID=UPI003392BD9F
MSGIYIHIPFCKKACHYCDFYFTTSLQQESIMVEAICTELVLKKERIKGNVASIYFGGGTPSILSEESLGKIFDTIFKNYTVDRQAEVTFEANPDDLTQEKIKLFKRFPINRFSIGIQSFFNEDLVWMNRAHNANEAETCVQLAQDNGFENLTIDLIYGFPLLTDLKLESNLDKALDLQIPHISAYALTVEPRTALAYAIKTKKQPPISDKQSADQFITLMEKLSANGFEQYEISNFAKPGNYAVHNTNYWRGVPFIGIGPSAHGFDGANRTMNPANNAVYLQKLEKDILPEQVEILSIKNRFNEYVMTSLRTMWGLSLDKVKQDFGETFLLATKKQLPKFLANGWLLQKGETIYLTQSGKLFADHIASEMFVVEED